MHFCMDWRSVRCYWNRARTLLVPIWLTSHRELSTSRRIRVVFDLLAAELGDR